MGGLEGREGLREAGSWDGEGFTGSLFTKKEKLPTGNNTRLLSSARTQPATLLQPLWTEPPDPQGRRLTAAESQPRPSSRRHSSHSASLQDY